MLFVPRLYSAAKKCLSRNSYTFYVKIGDIFSPPREEQKISKLLTEPSRGFAPMPFDSAVPPTARQEQMAPILSPPPLPLLFRPVRFPPHPQGHPPELRQHFCRLPV